MSKTKRGKRTPGAGALALFGLLAAACTTGTTQLVDAGLGEGSPAGPVTLPPTTLSYPLVDTGQTHCYGENTERACPASGAFAGQDAQYRGYGPAYRVSGDGLTVEDRVTGLTWTRSPDLDGDGDIDAADKLSYSGAKALPAKLNKAKFGGFSDWRLPTIKELYSLILFSGTDPSGPGSSELRPFIDTAAFAFGYGDTGAGERAIDAQFASSSLYQATVGAGMQLLFGVNFADGRIKGYGLKGPTGAEKTFYVYCVRGNPAYGDNLFKSNGDGTITDRATGLTWAAADSGTGMTWAEALAWVARQNAAGYLGHSDWRLPNIKELQSIVDYSRGPEISGSAAIHPLFRVSSITNETGQRDFPYFWSSTTHAQATGMGTAGAYVAFGRALGYMGGGWIDVHGAGAQRSDPKQGDPSAYPTGHGPQGDAIRIENYARLVRGGAATPTAGDPPRQPGGFLDGGPAFPPDGLPPGPRPDGVAGPRPDGPLFCSSQSDCEKPGACPPDAKKGCTCAPVPGGGSHCNPACQSDADCPRPPGMTLSCQNKLCKPAGAP